MNLNETCLFLITAIISVKQRFPYNYSGLLFTTDNSSFPADQTPPVLNTKYQTNGLCFHLQLHNPSLHSLYFSSPSYLPGLHRLDHCDLGTQLLSHHNPIIKTWSVLVMFSLMGYNTMTRINLGRRGFFFQHIVVALHEVKSEHKLKGRNWPETG